MKIYLKPVTIILFLLIASTTCLSCDILFPQGWRAPTSSETKDEWRNKDVNKYLYVRADFNGDGVIDQANLLIRDNDGELGLFAFVSQKDGLYKTFLLDEKKDINYIKVLGISKVPPGKYKTACGKGIIECAQGEADEILLQYDAINYLKVGSAEMYYYWDKTTESFKSIGIND